MGLGETAENFTPEEDPSTSTEGGLSRVGMLSRATMRQGVDQPCRIRGSGGCGPALPTPSPPAHGATSLGGVGGNWKMEEDNGGGAGPRPTHLAAAAAGLLQPRGSLRLQRAAAGGGGGGGGGGPCRGGVGRACR
jgi:hypothetical protein